MAGRATSCATIFDVRPLIDGGRVATRRFLGVNSSIQLDPNDNVADLLLDLLAKAAIPSLVNITWRVFRGSLFVSTPQTDLRRDVALPVVLHFSSISAGVTTISSRLL
jgi:hypothetical protein